MNIPVEFYNEKKAGKRHPVVGNVGELIEQLERLPKDLELRGSWPGEVQQLIVYNFSSDPFLAIESRELD